MSQVQKFLILYTYMKDEIEKKTGWQQTLVPPKSSRNIKRFVCNIKTTRQD
jgi:hypothetical protein